MRRIIKILAVDREEIILLAIKKALKNDNNFEYIISSSQTALDGLKLVRNESFDIILIDLVLPGINGIEVLKRIKKIYPYVPIIILSGYPSEKISSDSVLNGASGLLIKPFTSDELKNMIYNILEK